MPSAAIVRSADDFSPIVRLEDDLVRRADDRAEIVRQPDDLGRALHAHTLPPGITVEDREKCALPVQVRTRSNHRTDAGHALECGA